VTVLCWPNAICKRFSGSPALFSIISYNKLQCLQRHALSGLNNLRVLSLHGNRISMLPEGSFEDLKSLTHM